MADQAPSYDDLYGPQATSKSPAPAPAAADPNAAPTYEDLYGKTPTVEELVVTGHRLAPPQDAAPQTPLGYAATTAGNIIPSAWNLIKGVGHTIAHPVQTVGTLGDIGGGVLQHGMNAATGGHAPQVFSTKTADAAGQMYKDRYGGWSNIKHTLETDPVGMLADVSAPFTGGGGALVAGADALGTAGRVGEVANVLRNVGKTAQVVGDVTNPINAVTKPIGALGAIADKTVVPYLGATTGAGADAVRGAFNAGRQGGSSQRIFRGAIKGQIAPKDIVKGATQQTDDMSDLLRNNPDMVGASDPHVNGGKPDATTIPLDDVKDRFKTDAISGRSKPPGYTGPAVGTGPSAEAVNTVGGMLKNYTDNPTLQTPQGLHSFIDQASKYRDTLPAGSHDFNLVDKTIQNVAEAIDDHAPVYSDQMGRIQRTQQSLSDATRAIQGGANTDKTMIQLGKNIGSLGDGGLNAIPAAVSGNVLKGLILHGNPASFAMDLMDTLGPALLGGHDPISMVTHAIPGAVASSPRLVGETANLVGRGYGKVEPVLRSIDKFGNNPYVKSGTLAGARANSESPDGTVTLRDYMDNK